MVATDASSSCGPHPKDHPPPPMAHEPKPTRVIMTPLEPSGRLDNGMCFLLLKAKQITPTQLKPRTGCGVYGSSRETISSGDRRSESAAAASWRWCALVA